jgi:hypothetical protein
VEQRIGEAHVVLGQAYLQLHDAAAARSRTALALVPIWMGDRRTVALTGMGEEQQALTPFAVRSGRVPSSPVGGLCTRLARKIAAI